VVGSGHKPKKAKNPSSPTTPPSRIRQLEVRIPIVPFPITAPTPWKHFLLPKKHTKTTKTPKPQPKTKPQNNTPQTTNTKKKKKKQYYSLNHTFIPKDALPRFFPPHTSPSSTKPLPSCYTTMYAPEPIARAPPFLGPRIVALRKEGPPVSHISIASVQITNHRRNNLLVTIAVMLLFCPVPALTHQFNIRPTTHTPHPSNSSIGLFFPMASVPPCSGHHTNKNNHTSPTHAPSFPPGLPFLAAPPALPPGLLASCSANSPMPSAGVANTTPSKNKTNFP